MKGYIFSILIISIIGGIISSLISDCESGLKKHINFIVGLICAICLTSPLVSVVSNATDIKNNISNFFDKIASEEIIHNSNQIIVNTGIEKVCEGIKATIIDKYGFEENEVIVEAEANIDEIDRIFIDKINIVLTGKASWSDVERVEEYLENLIGCDISVKRR
ncbi:MAG: hypothetical protein J6A53_00035 [Clostridia bacterium]|nr:hypothetical protein [Clostridia bacterium]